MAEYIRDNGIPEQDPVMERPYIFQPYHLILSFASRYISVYIASILIPIISGLLSLILFYLILNKLGVSPFRTSVILLTLVLSPLFIFLFSTSNPYSIATLLVLLGFYLFTKQKSYFLYETHICIFRISHQKAFHNL